MFLAEPVADVIAVTVLMDAKILLEHGTDGIAFGFDRGKMLDKKAHEGNDRAHS